MRRRFMTTLLGLTVTIVLLYAIPRGIWVVQQERSSHEAQVDRVAVLVSEVVSAREAAGLPVDADDLAGTVRPDEWAVYTLPDGTRIETRPGATPSGGDVVATHEVDDGGTVTLVRSGGTVARTVWDALRALVLVGIGLIVLSYTSTHLLARWLARPFQNLATAAERLGAGDFDIEVPRSGLPEADAVGDRLRQSAAELRRALEREREFTVHASHELRTPLTAMQLELEDLALQMADRPEGEQVHRVLDGLQRLQGAVDDVLDRDHGRGPSDATEIDLATRLTDIARAWNDSGTVCTVELDGIPEVTVRVSRTTLDRTLELLLRHVCAPGCGPVTVGARDLGDAVQITVCDASRPVTSEIFTRRPGMPDTGSPGEDGATAHDVVAAREAAESMGGRLTLDAGTTTTFVLTIPRG